MIRFTYAKACALLTGGIMGVQLGFGCSDAETRPERESAGAVGSAGAANAGAAQGGTGPQTLAAAGTAGAAGMSGVSDAGESPTDPDASPCSGRSRLAYDMPGCDGSVVARCLFNDDPCATIACSCKGETIIGGCGYLDEPFAYRGRCIIADVDARAP